MNGKTGGQLYHNSPDSKKQKGTAYLVSNEEIKINAAY